MAPPKNAIQRFMGLPDDWEVRERIRFQLVLQPSIADVETATPGDPRSCALCVAFARMYSGAHAAIGRRWAFFEMVDEFGKPYIARMQAHPETRKAIKVFDATGDMPSNGFRFLPVAPSLTRKAKAKDNRRRYRTAKRAEESAPTAKRASKKTGPAKQPRRKLIKPPKEPTRTLDFRKVAVSHSVKNQIDQPQMAASPA